MPIRQASTALIIASLAGAAHARPPSTVPFPAEINISTLLPVNGGDGSTGFVLNGFDGIDYCGWSVSSAGDINGDGIDDIIIGAPYADGERGFSRERHTDPSAPSAARNGWYAGESYVIFGAVGLGATGAINLSSLNGADGFVINGIDFFEQSGRSVSSAGDVNGDGFDDLIIGAPHASPNGREAAGETYVVFGGPGVGAAGFINLSALNSADGFVLFGLNVGDNSGRAVSSAGDVNGDGFDDLIIGAHVARPNGQAVVSASYVVFGGPGVGAAGPIDLSALDGADGFALFGIHAHTRHGHSVSSAGDVNGDGVDDLIIGAPGNGESYVVFGGPGIGPAGSINLAFLNGADGFVINGVDAYSASGWSVSSAGDVNADGFDDLIIGAYAARPNGQIYAGESYVVFGGVGVGAGGVLNLSALDGANGFVLIGVKQGGRSGFSVSSAGDLNADGVDDIIIGAPYSGPLPGFRFGASYVIFGGAGVGAGGSFDLSSLNGSNGFVLHGIDPLDHSGHSVSCAGDVNDDGIDDIIIGAFGATQNGQSRAGESYIIFGRNLAPPPHCPGNANADTTVDFDDITTILANWHTNYAPSTGPGDANNDTIVNADDITATFANWLNTCP